MAHKTRFKREIEIEIKSAVVDMLQLIEQLRCRRFANVHGIAHILVESNVQDEGVGRCRKVSEGLEHWKDERFADLLVPLLVRDGEGACCIDLQQSNRVLEWS